MGTGGWRRAFPCSPFSNSHQERLLSSMNPALRTNRKFPVNNSGTTRDSQRPNCDPEHSHNQKSLAYQFHLAAPACSWIGSNIDSFPSLKENLSSLLPNMLANNTDNQNHVDSILVFGGRNEEGRNSDRLWRYDFHSGLLTHVKNAIGQSPSARKGACASSFKWHSPHRPFDSNDGDNSLPISLTSRKDLVKSLTDDPSLDLPYIFEDNILKPDTSWKGSVYSMIVHGGRHGEDYFGDLWELRYFNSHKGNSNYLWSEIIYEKVGTENFPKSRNHHSCHILSEKMYIFGGRTGREKDYQNDLWEFDLQRRLWRDLFVQRDGDRNIYQPAPRFLPSMDATSNSTLVVFGGEGIDSSLNDVWEFSLESNQWQLLIPPVACQKSHMS
eukprot:GHVL01007122.1.p1 GENE.GHVL01007122.1~~GHVL01007122.1.p1  ORF type:complete len:384 (-),score=44.96 GHVL01007122.1:1057-2208(-)